LGFHLAGVGRIADAFPLGLLLRGCLSVAWNAFLEMGKAWKLGMALALPFKKNLEGIQNNWLVVWNIVYFSIYWES